MKITKLLTLIIAISLNTVFAQGKIENDASHPTIEDRYFGEKPPGLIPKLFAPDIVSPEGNFEGGNFSPDMKEFYFTRKNGKYKKRTFFVIRYENNSWGHESETDIRWPQFSEDGNMMYAGKEYRERTDTGWSEPKNLGEFLKDSAHGTSLSSKGTYYFGFNEKEGRGYGSIRYSRLINGKRENPVKMSKAINTGRWIAHPFIAPDESYLMWDAEREGGYGDNDLYISFRHKDGTWGAAINMGDKINTSSNESSPGVTHDGKYFFFTRGDWEVKEDGSTNYVGKRYWVDAQVIENLRPNNISFEQNLPKFVQVEGGTFTMGDAWGQSNKDQRPTHEVTLKSFNISQTEVTVAQYRYYCNATGVAMPKEPSWGWQNNHPIVNISWQDAINYADWLSEKLEQMVRLPYEAEWEYAARGGNKAKGYKYSGANNIADVSWYDDNSGNKTNAVAGKKANELGLYDMSGNVWEWCMDKYAGDYYADSPKNNPKGAAKGDARAIRGGGWNLNATFSSVAYRYGSTFDGELYDYFGFRVVSVKK